MTNLSDTLAERSGRYGDFTDHANLAQNLQDSIRRGIGWPDLSADKKQALTTITDKIARILTGDAEYKDNWHDIQGYAKLAEDRCAGTTPPTSVGRCAKHNPNPSSAVDLTGLGIHKFGRS
jgi:hypothetical protein